MRRFSIRDLFWLTLVVGLAVGWWVDRTRLERQYRLETIRAYLLLESGHAVLPPARLPAAQP